MVMARLSLCGGVLVRLYDPPCGTLIAETEPVCQRIELVPVGLHVGWRPIEPPWKAIPFQLTQETPRFRERPDVA